jgi:2',3'-cyclic-nucleotide 2'-phosphodiesterase (5'-nucleotidase family)
MGFGLCCGKKASAVHDSSRRISIADAAKVLGTSHVALDSRDTAVRWNEGHLTNWISDVVAENWVAADFAMLVIAVDAKSLMPEGDITYGYVTALFPKPEPACAAVLVKLTGAQVVKSLERGCASRPGSLHHTSAKLSYAIVTSAQAGERVDDVCFGGEPIDLFKTYTVAVTASQAEGELPGYDWMVAAPRVDDEVATPIFELVRNWLKKHKALPADLPGEGTRIRIHAHRH